jgi:hypothetical protein
MMIDAGVDAPPDAAQLCFGSFVQVCFTAASDVPTAAVSLNDRDLDTDDVNMCNQRNNKAGSFCVVAGDGLVLDAGKTLRAHGSKPLILLSTTAVDLEGVVDVSSTGHALATQGAGAASAAGCPGAGVARGNSGGAGGSFAGVGGDGQRLDTANSPTAAPAVAFPNVLRGGCSGGNGAKGDVPDLGGAGGSGGGAVAIIGPSIVINNKIDASGAGGSGGPIGKSGGGGGGSGGMIVVDVPMDKITRGASGMLYANGGGGGEGGVDPAGAGLDGAAPAGPTPSAPGGSSVNGNDGGNGGQGSSGSDLGGATSPGQAGGGGGGGGGGGAAGYVYAPGITGSTVISPPSQNHL